MEQTTNVYTVNSLLKAIYSLPVEYLPKVEDFVESLKKEGKRKTGTWNRPDSLLNSKPLNLGERDWRRDDLYDRTGQS